MDVKLVIIGTVVVIVIVIIVTILAWQSVTHYLGAVSKGAVLSSESGFSLVNVTVDNVDPPITKPSYRAPLAYFSVHNGLSAPVQINNITFSFSPKVDVICETDKIAAHHGITCHFPDPVVTFDSDVAINYSVIGSSAYNISKGSIHIYACFVAAGCSGVPKIVNGTGIIPT